jgi:hypothetical protein
MNYSRRINTEATLSRLLGEKIEQGETDVTKPQIDNYLEIAAKLIPQEVIFVYLSGYTFLQSVDLPNKIVLLWVLFVMCFIFNILYSKYKLRIDIIAQLVLGAIAFIPWAVTIGGVFDVYSEYARTYGMFGLIIFSLLPPLFFMKKLPPIDYSAEN